jgi:predicted choloylglycine hydrolase
MLLYNVTVGIDKEVEQEWLSWMKSKHMTDVVNTGMFMEARIYKILHNSEEETVSYSVQYFAKSLDDVEQYLEKYAPALREEANEKFKGKHVAFRTLLEEV